MVEGNRSNPLKVKEIVECSFQDSGIPQTVNYPFPDRWDCELPSYKSKYYFLETGQCGQYWLAGNVSFVKEICKSSYGAPIPPSHPCAFVSIPEKFDDTRVEIVAHSHRLDLTTSNRSLPLRVAVFALTGQQVLETTFQHHTQLDCAYLPHGLYYLQIPETGQVEKLLVQEGGVHVVTPR